MSTIKNINVLGIPIADIPPNDLLNTFEEFLENGEHGWITGINAHALNLAIEYTWLRHFYNSALLNCAEGVGVVIAAWLSGVHIPKRKPWADLFDGLFNLLQRKGYKMFLLGSTEKNIVLAEKVLKKKFPDLKIVGVHHGYFNETHSKIVIEIINRTQPDVLLVGMGMPKQELWIYNNSKQLKVKLIFPVGALIDYISGVKKRCPKWMSEIGMEWVFRLLLEPTRVWRRYIVGNPLLIVRSLLYRYEKKE